MLSRDLHDDLSLFRQRITPVIDPEKHRHRDDQRPGRPSDGGFGSSAMGCIGPAVGRRRILILLSAKKCTASH
jgi:hypothetical protein